MLHKIMLIHYQLCPLNNTIKYIAINYYSRTIHQHVKHFSFYHLKIRKIINYT